MIDELNSGPPRTGSYWLRWCRLPEDPSDQQRPSTIRQLGWHNAVPRWGEIVTRTYPENEYSGRHRRAEWLRNMPEGTVYFSPICNAFYRKVEDVGCRAVFDDDI